MRRFERPLVWLLLAFLAVVWGTQYLVIRAAQTELPVWLAVAARFAIVAACGHAMVSRERVTAPPGRRAERLLLGVTHALAMGLVYLAERSESSAVAACVMASTPLFIAILSARWIAGEPLTRRIAGTAALGLVGVALLFAHRLDAPRKAYGLGLLVVAAAASAISKTVGKRLAQLPAAVLVRDLGVVVALSATALWLLFERGEVRGWTLRSALGILYLGLIASSAASGVWFVLLRRVPITRLSHLQFVTAIVGVVAGAVVGRERLHVNEVAGIATILAAVVIASRTTRSPAPAGATGADLPRNNSLSQRSPSIAPTSTRSPRETTGGVG